MSSQIIKVCWSDADVGQTVDVALSTSAAMTSPTLVGVRTIDANRVSTHTPTGLTASTKYYGRLVQPATGAYFGEQFSFTTAPPTTGDWSRLVAILSCNENSADHPQVWQDLLDRGTQAVWWLGDPGYWGQAISSDDPPSKDQNKYTAMAQSNPTMRAALQAVSIDIVLISDHNIHINGDTWLGSTPEDTFGCLHAVRELLSFQEMMPQRTYWDTRTPRQYRGHTLAYGDHVLIHCPDMRTPERSMASDPDTEDKQLWGADQETKFFAALDPAKLNWITTETSWWDAAGHLRAHDKPAAYPNAQQRLKDKLDGTGPFTGGPVYPRAYAGGDRHYTGEEDASTHPLGAKSYIGSGTSKNSLDLQIGETPTWQFGANLRTRQTVTLTGSVTTFTLTYNGQTTSAIAGAATAATVKTALEALSNIAPGDVVVSGSAGGPYEIRFGGLLYGNTIELTSASSGGTCKVTQEDCPVVTYLELLLEWDHTAAELTVTSQGRAVLDTSGPDEAWVIANIPGGSSVTVWSL